MSKPVCNERQAYLCDDDLVELSLKNIPYVMSLYQYQTFSSNGSYAAILFESRYDTQIELILQQLSRFLSKEWSVILYVTEPVYDLYVQLCNRLSTGIQVKKITYVLSNVIDYNNIMLDVTFWKTLEHFKKILVFQADTMIYRYGIEHFYKYDYIGAPWPKDLGLPNCVGNGGFSLRTTSAMIDCLSNMHKIFIVQYSQYFDNAKRLNWRQPEDVIFSQGMSQLGYKIPSSTAAQHFSIETYGHNEYSIGSHQLDRFSPSLSNTILLNSVIPYFIESASDISGHRFGWNYVTSHLHTIFSNPTGVHFNTWCDTNYLFENIEMPYKKPWVGIFHLTPVHTNQYYKDCNIDHLLQNETFLNDLPYCKGIFTLSKYMQQYVKDLLNSIGFSHIKVDYLYHPVSFSLSLFDPSMINTINRVVSLGSQLRRCTTIYRIKTNYKRIWLAGRSKDRCYEILEDECDEFGIHLSEKDLERVSIKELSNKNYDQLLVNSFIIIDLYDASANNAVIECIARNIPCFVKRLPAIEEYIGSTYPLLFNDIHELEQMLEDKDKIRSAYFYLVEHQELKDNLTIDRFIHDILHSEITKQILTISDEIIYDLHDHSIEENVKKICADLIQHKNLLDSVHWYDYTKIESNQECNIFIRQAITKAKEIVKKLQTINITFQYGKDDNIIDITTIIYSKCIEQIEFKINEVSDKKWCIYIPMGDLNRDQLFGDPLPNVHKIIYVRHHGIMTTYNELQSYLFII